MIRYMICEREQDESIVLRCRKQRVGSNLLLNSKPGLVLIFVVDCLFVRAIFLTTLLNFFFSYRRVLLVVASMRHCYPGTENITDQD